MILDGDAETCPRSQERLPIFDTHPYKRMMIYVLIDNCTLLQLVAVSGYNEYIAKLVDGINNNQMRLLTHENIINEWERHKLKHQRRKEQKLISFGNENSTELGQTNNLLPKRHGKNALHIDLQTQQIDDLLARSIRLSTPNIVTGEFAERYRLGLAPFHNKKDSLNDWEIIGSSCVYCESQAIPTLYFLSHNHTDFADEEEVNRTIHPTLQKRFPNVKIEYFKHYSNFFEETDSFERIPHHLLPFRLIANSTYSFKSSVKETDIKSLLFIYNELYKEVNFIPTHILSKYFPFADSENGRTYYGTFNIHNVREGLLDVLENIKIDGDKVSFKEPSVQGNLDNDEQEATYVLSKLTRNLVFEVRNDRNRFVSTHYLQYIQCDCAKCAFSRFEFKQAFAQLKNETKDLKEMLKLGYIHCQLGNFKKSASIFLEIAAQSHNQKKYLTYFIARYNLKHLGSFLNNFFYNKQIDSSLVSRLSEIDPIEDAVKLKGYTDYNFLSFIAQEDYVNEAFQEIAEALNEIRDHYHSQVNGGWSSNQKIWKLSNAFAKLDAFVNDNFILFDQYKNFKKLFELVIEALFASHAITESQGERIEEFDDYWVHKIVVYGDKKSIIKYFNRYNLKTLRYRSTGHEKDSFIELAQNLFANGYSNTSTQDDEDFGNEYFPTLFNQLFENLLTIGAILELDTAVVNRFGEHLLKFLTSDTKIYPSSMSSVALFVRRKGRTFSDELMLKYFDTLIDADAIKHGELFGALAKQIGKRLAILDHKRIDLLITLTTTKCEECEKLHSTQALVDLFHESNDDLKKQISTTVQTVLATGFDFDLYYMAVIHDLIPFEAKQLFSLVEKFDVNENHRSLRSVFTGQSDYNNYLNALLNVCFKFEVDLSSSTFEKLKHVSNYYSWLIDMDGFNYLQFKPEWVLEHQTTYFFKKMASSKNCLAELRQYLKVNSHEGIENVLLRITNFTS